MRNVDRIEVDGIRDHGGGIATTRDVLERVRSTSCARFDVLDSSVAPRHSLPNPGGLSYRERRALLAAVARRGRVIGFDVVELNPALDPSGATSRVATWTATHLLGEIFDQAR